MAGEKFARLKLLNGKELAEKFRAAGKKVQDKIDKSLLKAGYLVERDVKKSFGTSPSPPGGPPGIITGTLKRSIATRLVPMNAQVGTNVVYARTLEFGYAPRNLEARPFLYPALERNKVEITRILREGLEDELATIFTGFKESTRII